MDIGKSIRLAMIIKDISREEICESFGWSKPALSIVINNKRGISLDVLKQLSDFFGFKVSEFIALGEKDGIKFS